MRKLLGVKFKKGRERSARTSGVVTGWFCERIQPSIGPCVMLTAFAGLALILSAPIDQRVEYKFRGNAARFVNVHWKSMKVAMADVQIAETVEGEPTGTWIFFDLKNNKAIVGSRDNSALDLVELLAQFDIVPHSVKLSLHITRADRGAELKSTLEVINNQTSYVGSPELGATVTVRPRMTEGDITLRVTLTVGDKSSAIDYRVKKKTPWVIDAGDVQLQKTTLSTGVIQGKDLWRPFRIEIAADILPPKK